MRAIEGIVVQDNGAMPAPQAVCAQMEKILASAGFAGAERLSRFVRYAVERALDGRSDQLKETVLGVEVFGRKPFYDPRIDGVVRTEAVKLRARLKEYYEGEGRNDPITIDFPRGGYVPVFHERAARAKPRRWRMAAAIAGGLVLTAALAAVVRTQKAHARNPLSSIAVMPFANVRAEKENEYFSDGLTGDLIDALTRVEGLRVVARSSAFQFKNKTYDIRTVGTQLSVGTVLEGSV